MIAPALIRREMRDAVRRYWFLVNAAVFAVAGIALMAVGDVDSEILGHRGLGRAVRGPRRRRGLRRHRGG